MDETLLRALTPTVIGVLLRRGADHPANREELTSPARDNGDHDSLVEKVSHVGPDRFDGPDDAQRALFGNEWYVRSGGAGAGRVPAPASSVTYRSPWW